MRRHRAGTRCLHARLKENPNGHARTCIAASSRLQKLVATCPAASFDGNPARSSLQVLTVTDMVLARSAAHARGAGGRCRGGLATRQSRVLSSRPHSSRAANESQQPGPPPAHHHHLTLARRLLSLSVCLPFLHSAPAVSVAIACTACTAGLETRTLGLDVQQGPRPIA
jgi:hypothetical protein